MTAMETCRIPIDKLALLLIEFNGGFQTQVEYTKKKQEIIKFLQDGIHIHKDKKYVCIEVIE